MKRRKFIGLVGGAAAWPLVARAQLERTRIIGGLLGIAEASPEGQLWLSAFRQGLAETGWSEGKNIQRRLRWPASDTNLMLTQATELLNEHCEVILTHASPATAALKKTAPEVANIFVAVVDPIASGFVESIAHPGGTSTGFTNFEPSMGGKWLELLKDAFSGLYECHDRIEPKDLSRRLRWFACTRDPRGSCVHSNVFLEFGFPKR